MRIATLNTWKNEGDYAQRLAAMVSGLSAVAPDIVLLQEAFRTCDDEAHTARELAAALQLSMRFAPARAKTRRWRDRDVPSESGLAILARGSIPWSERLKLPSDEAGGERIALLAEISIDGVCVVAGCMHLSHVRGDHARRREQLETILAHPVWSSPAALRVLGGDTNATLDSPALDWLDDHSSLRINTALPSHLARPTHPFPPRRDRPGRTIDHLFSISPHRESLAPIKSAGVTLHEAIDGTFASDHAAVVAEFSVAVPGLSSAAP